MTAAEPITAMIAERIGKVVSAPVFRTGDSDVVGFCVPGVPVSGIVALPATKA